MKLKKIIPAFLLLSTVAVGLWLTPTQASADARYLWQKSVGWILA